MNPKRRTWITIGVVAGAFIATNVILPRVLPNSPIVAALMIGIVLVYIIGTIVTANVRRRISLPRLRRPRRLRSVASKPNAAATFIEEFERRHQR